jgi:pyruvate formate lyase activating enzyme
VSEEPLKELLPFIDAANIDIKSIRNDFYKKTCSGGVDEVLKTVETMCGSCHVELTNLIIPTLNDSPKDISDLVDWVAFHCGPTVPLHFSRYFPCYKMTIPPTPVETLEKAEAIARKKLKYVYLGNV